MASTKKPTAKKPPPKKPAASKRPPAKARAKRGTGRAAADMRKLAFVDAYIKNGNNATEAAKAAGYSPNGAGQTGHKLLKDAQVQRMLTEIGARLAAKYRLSVEMVERSIAQELAFDPANLYDSEGRLKRVADMDEDTRAALVSVEIEEQVARPATGALRQKETLLASRSAKVRWVSKQGAREQAMKYLGMFEKDNVQKTPLTGMPPELLDAARAHLVSLIAAQKAAGAPA